jgi:EpsD family peptidyl-prolyl cis-trans isomerase
MPPFLARAMCLVPCLWGLSAPHAAVPAPVKSGPPPTPSPVVATVDGEPITLQRLQVMAWRLSQRQPKGPPVSQQEALEQLINLQLQARQAQLQGVDTVPAVAELLAITQMEVLAKGLSDIKRQLQVPPTEAQVKAYYDRTPELFSRRRIYALQELQLEQSPWSPAELKRQVAKAESMKALSTALEQAGATVKLNHVTQSAENLPLEALPDIAAAPEGKPQWRALPNGGGLIYVVVASRTQTRTLEEAAPLIRLFLSNKDWMEQTERAVAEMREKAHIERKPLPPNPEPHGSFTFGP